MIRPSLAIISVVLLPGSLPVEAASTIDPVNKYAYGANIGWINAEADGTNGAVIGQAFCQGYLYGANVGWIHLGDGSPDNGVAYQNDSATDYGVNHDGLGHLSGHAYGANIGWITFEQTQGKPRIDLLTGAMNGYAWGANIGWIGLSNGFARVRTLTLDPGPDTDSDGIPDPWEYGHTNNLATLNGGDADGDGVPDLDEYLADTNPFDPGDYLRITDFQVVGMTTNRVTWPVQPTRLYTLQYATGLNSPISWSKPIDPFIPSAGPEVVEIVTGATNSSRFYRVLAEPPLSP